MQRRRGEASGEEDPQKPFTFDTEPPHEHSCESSTEGKRLWKQEEGHKEKIERR